ncbi:MAG TPA: glycine zipper domain-containing protein [Chitinophagaceae bacterium]
MKKLVLIFIVATTFIACNSRQDKTAGVDSTAITPKKVVVQKEVHQASTSTSQNNAQVQEKKGMSKAAKGAIIGGVGGAVIGGVATKSAKGAVIGGAVGATGGYIIGRSKDKKDGRVNQ